MARSIGLLGFLALCSFSPAGCAASSDPLPEQPSMQRPTLDEDISRRTWSTLPISLHGVGISFELAEGEEEPLPRTSTDGVVIGEGRRQITCNRVAFWFNGRSFKFPGGTDLRVFLPPVEGIPWRRESGGLEIVWHGDGVRSVFEETRTRRDEDTGELYTFRAWHIGNAEIYWKPGGTPVYELKQRGKKEPIETATLSLPTVLTLDASGRRL